MPTAAGIRKGRQSIDPRIRAGGAVDPFAEIRPSGHCSGLADLPFFPSPDALASRPLILSMSRIRLARRDVCTGAPSRADVRRSDAGRAAHRRAIPS